MLSCICFQFTLLEIFKFCLLRIILNQAELHGICVIQSRISCGKKWCAISQAVVTNDALLRHKNVLTASMNVRAQNGKEVRIFEIYVNRRVRLLMLLLGHVIHTLQSSCLTDNSQSQPTLGISPHYLAIQWRFSLDTKICS